MGHRRRHDHSGKEQGLLRQGAEHRPDRLQDRRRRKHQGPHAPVRGSGSGVAERQVCGHVPGQGRLQEHRLRHRRLPFRRYGFPYRLLEAERRLHRRSELRPEQGRHRQKRAERPGVPCVQPHPDERLRRQQGRGHLPLRSQEIRRRNGKARLEEGQGRHLRAQRAEVLVHDSGPGL